MKINIINKKIGFGGIVSNMILQKILIKKLLKE